MCDLCIAARMSEISRKTKRWLVNERRPMLPSFVFWQIKCEKRFRVIKLNYAWFALLMLIKFQRRLNYMSYTQLRGW